MEGRIGMLIRTVRKGPRLQQRRQASAQGCNRAQTWSPSGPGEGRQTLRSVEGWRT